MYNFIPFGCQDSYSVTDEEKADNCNRRRPLNLVFLWIFKTTILKDTDSERAEPYCY